MRTLLHIIPFLLLLPKYTSANTQYQIGDTLQVWSKTGLNLRTQPSINGSILMTLNPGEKVTVIGKTSISYSSNLFSHSEKEFLIKGNWMLVSTSSFEGYVFDAYLLPAKFEIANSFYEFINENTLNTDTIIYDPEAGYESIHLHCKTQLQANIQNEILLYGAGSEEKFIIENWTIQQAFIFINYFLQFHLTDNSLNQPQVFENTSDKLIFGNRDICQLSFVYVGNAVQINYHCSC